MDARSGLKGGFLGRDVIDRPYVRGILRNRVTVGPECVKDPKIITPGPTAGEVIAGDSAETLLTKPAISLRDTVLTPRKVI